MTNIFWPGAGSGPGLAWPGPGPGPGPGLAWPGLAWPWPQSHLCFGFLNREAPCLWFFASYIDAVSMR